MIQLALWKLECERKANVLLFVSWITLRFSYIFASFSIPLFICSCLYLAHLPLETHPERDPVMAIPAPECTKPEDQPTTIWKNICVSWFK